MANKEKQAETIRANWATLALKVLSCVLRDPGASIPVVDIFGGNFQWFPPEYHQVYTTIERCVAAHTPPTPTAVSTASGGVLTIVELDAIAGAWTADNSRFLMANAQALKKMGIVFQLRSLGELASNVTNPEEIDEIISYLEIELQGISASKSLRDASIKTVSEGAWKFSGKAIPTGLPWLDDVMGGLWTGMIGWVAARYKGGKSTLMRALALAAAEAGHPVEIFVAEGSREGVALALEVAVAVRFLLEMENELKNIDLSVIKLSMAHLPEPKVHLSAIEIDALARAKTYVEGLPIRVWDPVDLITNLVTLNYRVRNGKMEHGTEVVFLDYAGLFNVGTPDGIYEKMTGVSTFLQNMAAKEGIAVWALSQKNEAGVKNTGKEGYSPHMVGGGSAPATADLLLQPHILKLPLGYVSGMRVALTHSRWCPPGRGDHALQPSSGAIIDEYVTMKTQVLTEMMDAREYEGDQYAQFGE